jgi:16S rRNA G966 N2-methylase RsmD
MDTRVAHRDTKIPHIDKTPTDEATRTPEFLFKANFPHVNPDQIKNGEERMMSTIEDARRTNLIMKRYCAEHGDRDTRMLTIADAFACLGGNTYAFSFAFKGVTAYEQDQTRYQGLSDNVSIYPEHQQKNITVKCQDCCTLGGILDTYHDVVFLDPPWFNQVTQKVDGEVFQYAACLCEQIGRHKKANYVFLKLPIQTKDKDNRILDFRQDMTEFQSKISTLWDDISTKTIFRARRKKPVYTIVCARLRVPPATHTPAAHTPAAHHAHVAALLTQLHTLSLFIQ